MCYVLHYVCTAVKPLSSSLEKAPSSPETRASELAWHPRRPADCLPSLSAPAPTQHGSRDPAPSPSLAPHRYPQPSRGGNVTRTDLTPSYDTCSHTKWTRLLVRLPATSASLFPVALSGPPLFHLKTIYADIRSLIFSLLFFLSHTWQGSLALSFMLSTGIFLLSLTHLDFQCSRAL